MRPDQVKRLCRLAHFRRRLRKHYRLDLTDELMREIRWRIRTRKGVRDMWGHAGKNTMAVTMRTSAGRIAMVYDVTTYDFVTALPAGARV